MDRKQSQFTAVDSLDDSDFVPVFGSGSNSKISKANLFNQIKDETQIFIYPTIEQLQAANLIADTEWPVYVRVEETEYRLYKITSLAAGPNDIELDNGTTATFQEEFSEIGFVVGPDSSVDGALAVFSGTTGTQLENGPVPTDIGTSLIEAPDFDNTGYIRVNPDNTVTVRNVSNHKIDLSLDQVNNTTDTNKPISTAAAAALALKAPLSSPAFTDNPTAPTPTYGDNDTSIATTEFVQEALENRPVVVETFADLASTPATTAGMIVYTKQHTSGGIGGGYFQDTAGTITNDDVTIINNSVTAGRHWKRINYDVLTPEMGGAAGTGLVDDTSAIGAWLDYLIANPKTVGAGDGVYLLNSISKTAKNGIILKGSGIIKATGSSRLNMFLLTGVTGHVQIDGFTFDGSNIVARPFEIKNTASATLGNVTIGENSRFINAMNVSPATDAAAGCRIQGNFEKVIFGGEIDGVDSNLTSGAVCIGFWSDWTGVYRIRNTVITSTAKIKNVKNSNTVLADADGLQCMGPTDVVSSLTVCPGALFKNCKGRAIKSQVVLNSIDSPVIERDAYDGIIEIDLQYGGGHVCGAKVLHDGTRTDYVIASAARLNLPSDITIKDNTLVVEGTPSSNTGTMAFIWGTDNTDAIKQQGIVIRDNKVRGAVNYMATVYGSNVVNVNRALIDGNWAKTIGTAFLRLDVVFNNNAQLAVVFTNNGSENSCTGSSIVSGGHLIVEEDRNNHNITPLQSRVYTIASGVLTIYGGSDIKIETEGGAGTNDIDTISGGSYAHDEQVTFRAASDARSPKFKNGTGNIYLAGSDFDLTSSKDRITLSYDADNSWWVEICRSDNGV
jgi:hypothetical protein